MTNPVWADAYKCWYAQAATAFQNISPDNKNTIQIFAARANQSICDFCLGPCGHCQQRYSGDPTGCDDCPQNTLGGATECSYCPYAAIPFAAAL